MVIISPTPLSGIGITYLPKLGGDLSPCMFSYVSVRLTNLAIGEKLFSELVYDK